ncbi:hypothetical protein BH20BAC1_BH20BAC1_00910 [soil metagenome]
MFNTTLLFCCFVFLSSTFIFAQEQAAIPSSLKIKHTPDFSISGKGTEAAWNKAEWNELQPRNFSEQKNTGRNLPAEVVLQAGPHYTTRFKILYSENGIYCLYECEDSIITATIITDFGDLYKEDVVEIFLWPDTSISSYFEYELSPLNFELPLLIINRHGKAMGWKPWKYEGSRQIIHAVNIDSNKINAQGRFTWSAEFFIPFKLLTPLVAEKPSAGTKWRANFYRIDYDGNPQYSSWKETRKNFHDFERFGFIEFE